MMKPVLCGYRAGSLVILQILLFINLACVFYTTLFIECILLTSCQLTQINDSFLNVLNMVDVEESFSVSSVFPSWIDDSTASFIFSCISQVLYFFSSLSQSLPLSHSPLSAAKTSLHLRFTENQQENQRSYWVKYLSKASWCLHGPISTDQSFPRLFAPFHLVSPD